MNTSLNKWFPVCMAFCCLFFALMSAAQAQLYWDGTNISSNGVIDGGTGTWNNSSSNWTGSNGSGNTPWSDGNTAVFGLVTGGTGTYAVSLIDTGFITAGGLVFNTGGYILSGSINAVTSGSGAALLYLTGDSTISVAQGQATLAVSLYDFGPIPLTSVIKSGAGTLVLAADNSKMDVSEAVSQQIVLNAGTLQTGSNAGASVFGGGVSYLTRLQLNGGTLQLTNTAGLTYQNNVAVAGNVQVMSDVAGAGVTNTFGTLSLSGTLLNLNNGYTTSGVSGLTFGVTTLTGSSTILSENYSGGNNLVTLSSVDGSGVNAYLTLGGYSAGNITVSGSTNLGTGKLGIVNAKTTTFGGGVTASSVKIIGDGTDTVILGGTGATSAAFANAQTILVDGAQLNLGSTGTASGAAVDRISDTATLTLQGATLMLTQLGAISLEKIGLLSLGAGNSTISGQASTGGVGSQYLGIGALGTIAPGAILNFSVSTSATANGSVQFSGTAPTLVNGIIGGWAIASGTDFATVSGTGLNVVAYSGYTPSTGDFTGTTTAINNVKLTLASGTTVTLASSGTVNSLYLVNSGTGTLNLGGNTLDIVTGGILDNGGGSRNWIKNGVLTAGTSSAPAELVFNLFSNSAFTLGAVIADNAQGGSVSVVLNNSANFSGAVNTYTGNTYVNSGNLAILTDRQLGAEPATSGSGQIYLSNGAGLTFTPQVAPALSANRGIVIGAGGATFNDTVSGIWNFNNPISGTGSLNFAAYPGVVEITGLNSYDGVTTLNPNCYFSSIGNVGGGPSALGNPSTAATGEIIIANFQGSTGYIGTGSAVTDRIFVETYNGAVANVNFLNQNGAGTLTLNGNFLAQGTSWVGLGGFGVGYINGNILGLNATSGLVVKGGDWHLTGENTYVGATTINAGILEFNTIGNVGSGASSLGAPTTAANGLITLGNNTGGATLRFTGNTAQTTDRAITFGDNASTLETIGTAPIDFAGPITLGANVLRLGGSGYAILSGTIGGGGGLTMNGITGLGEWVISSTASLTYTGATTVSSGTLALNFANLASKTNLINASSPLTLSGGDLNIIGAPAGSTSQTFTTLTASGNTGSVLNINANGGAQTTFGTTTLGWSLNQGSTLDIETSGNVIIAGTAALTGTAGVIFNVTIGGTNFATVSGGNLVASDWTTYAALPTTTGNTTGAYQLTGNQTQTGNASYYGLKIVPSGPGQSLNLGTYYLGTYSVNSSQAVIFDGSLYSYTITGSNGAYIGSSGNDNTTLDFFINGSNPLILNTSIGWVTQNNPSNLAVNKAGPGVLIVGDTNASYYEPTNVQNGTLKAGNNGGFSSRSNYNIGAAGILAVNGYSTGILSLVGSGIVENGASSSGTLTIGANNTNGSITTNTATLGYGSYASAVAFSGIIEDGGAGSLSLVKAGYGYQWLSTPYDALNTYTGSTSVTAGLLGISKLDDSGVASSIGAGSIINLGSFAQTGVLQEGSPNNESNRTVNLATNGDGGIDVQVGGTPGAISQTPVGAFSGALLTLSGTVTGAGQLQKLGGGNLVLSGVNNYTGGTVIDYGILQFANSSSVPSTGSIAVNYAGTVGTGYALDQTFLNKVTSTSQGVVALGADSGAALDFTNLPNVSLGATGHYVFTGTINPANSTYQLGGGGYDVVSYGSSSVNNTSPAMTSALFIANPNTLNGANNLLVSPHGSTGAGVVLDASQSYTGTTTVAGGLNPLFVGTGYPFPGSFLAGYYAYAELDVTGTLGTSAVNLNPLGIFKLVASVAQPGQMIGSNTPLNFNGGTFEYLNDASNSNFALTTGTAYVNRGASEIVLGGAVSGQTSQLTLGGLRRTAGSTLELVGVGLGTTVSATNSITFGGAGSGLSTTLATPWASINSVAYTVNQGDGASDFAMIDLATGYVKAVNAPLIGSATLTSGSLNGADWTINGSTYGTVTLTGNQSPNTLRVIGASSTILVGSNTLAVNGIMNTAAPATTTIGAYNDGGTLTSANLGGEIILNAAQASQNGNSLFNILTNIKDNGAPVSVVTTGYGTITLAGSNTFSGGLVIDGYSNVTITGTTVGNNIGTNSLGTGPITMNGGELNLGNNGLNFPNNSVVANNWIINADSYYNLTTQVNGMALTGSITLNNNATFWILASNGYAGYNSYYNGAISGTGNIGFIQDNQYNNNQTFVVSGSTNNSYNGTTYIQGGTYLSNHPTIVSLEKLYGAVAIPGNIVLGQYNPTFYNAQQDILILNGNGLLSGSLSANQIASTSQITFAGGQQYSAGVFQLNNQNSTIQGILSNAVGDGEIQNNASTSGTSLLTLQTVTGQNTNFSGVLHNHDNSNSNAGILALTVTGAGTQQLGGVSNYSGTTTVTGSATLVVSGSLTSSPVSVNTATATLGGNGGIAQNVTVTNGGQLAPGLHSAGSNYGGPSSTLTLASAGTLTLTSANLDFDLDTTAASANNDKIATGALSLGSTIIFNFSQLTPGTLEIGQPYTLISANSISGFSAGNISTTWVNGTPYTATYSVVGYNLDVTFTAVPEPGTWSLLVGGLAMLSCFQRVRRNRR